MLWHLIVPHLSPQACTNLCQASPNLNRILSESFWERQGYNSYPALFDIAFYTSWKRIFTAILTHPCAKVRAIGLAHDNGIIYDRKGEVYHYHNNTLHHLPNCSEVFWLGKRLYYLDEKENLYYVSSDHTPTLMHKGVWQLYQHHYRVWLLDNDHCLHKVSVKDDGTLTLSSPTKVTDLYTPVVDEKEELIRIANCIDPDTESIYKCYHCATYHRKASHTTYRCYCVLHQDDGHIPYCGEFNNIDYLFSLDEHHVLLMGERNEIMAHVRGRLRTVLKSLKVIVIRNKPFFLFDNRLMSWTDYLCYREGKSHVALNL